MGIYTWTSSLRLIACLLIRNPSAIKRAWAAQTLFALSASLLALAIAALSSSRGGQWNEAFLHVARRFHAVLHPAGWFRPPSVWLRHGEAQARLTVAPIRGSGHESCLQFTIEQ